MAVKNSTILAKAWLSGSDDFQQRIPEPTQGMISQTINALFSPLNKRYLNQFMDVLVNRIGFTYVRGKRFENPLAVFKDGKLDYGTTIQEIAPKWIKAHSYMDDDETLLKLNRPEAAVWYHSMNREDRYDISIVRDELRQAFTEEYGLNQLIARIMDVPINSDNYDEYRIMLHLLQEYDQRFGFFKHELSGAPTDEETGKELLTAIRTYIGRLQFPSTLYNGVDDIPVFADPDELVLFVTPEVDANLDVQALAVLFNLDKADVPVRKILVDEFLMANAQALLTTSDFFVCKDVEYETTSFWNPQTLATNYYLHHWGVYSISPFVPAILFTTEDGTETSTITQTVSGITLSPDSGTIEPGGTQQLTVKLTGTITDNEDGVVVAPDAATFEVACTRGEDPDTVSVPLNARTRVDRLGVLHVQKSGLETGDVITVTATSTYLNPSGITTEYTDSSTFTVA